MRLLSRLKVGSLQDRLLGLVLAMISVTLVVAASAGNKAPGIVPVVLEGFAILMLATLLGAAKWDFHRDAVKSMFGSGLSIAAIAFFVFTAISCVSSNNRAVSLQGAAQVGVGVLLYFVVSLNVQATRHLSRIAIALTVMAFVGALIGCAEYGANADGQAICLFGDHQLYGSFLMFLLPFVTVFAISEKNLNRQLLAQTATVATIIALVLAHSHSSWLGAGIGLISVGLLLTTFPTNSKSAQPGQRKLLAPALLISAGILFLVMDSPISESLLNSPYSFASSPRQDAGMDRQQVWRGTMRMIAEHPLTGLGAAMYAYSHHPYTGLSVLDAPAHVRPTLFDQTHNLYLQTAAEIGIPGSLALITIVVIFLITGVRRLKSIERSDRRYMCLASLGAMAAFAADAFSSPSWQFGQIMILVWLALGVGVACLRQTSTRDVRRPGNIISVPTWFRPPAEAVGLLSLAALMPVTVIASTRLNSFYPTTVYGSLNRTVHHIAICVLPDPYSAADVAADTKHYTSGARFVQPIMPKSTPHLPAPAPDPYQTVKPGPHYRLQLEVFIRDNNGVYDGGPITLDPNTHWSTLVCGTAGEGSFKPEPYRYTYAEGSKSLNYGGFGNCMAYISVPADLGNKVDIVATYAGLKATAVLDFTTGAKHPSPRGGSRSVSGFSCCSGVGIPSK